MPKNKGVTAMKVLSTVFLTGTILLAGNAAQAANMTQAAPAPAATTAGIPALASAPSSVSQRKQRNKRFFGKCHRSKRFNERRVAYGTNAILGGRCATSRAKRVKLVSSYAGHQPSAGRALDIMVNRSGSCHSGRSVGNRVARYFMNNSGKHRVQYVIWKNRIWQSYEKRRNTSNWRAMNRGGNCTTRHFDHVHVSFK
jgi:hypothetical protein